jgi:hypothetical protein
MSPPEISPDTSKMHTRLTTSADKLFGGVTEESRVDAGGRPLPVFDSAVSVAGHCNQFAQGRDDFESGILLAFPLHSVWNWKAVSCVYTI